MSNGSFFFFLHKCESTTLMGDGKKSFGVITIGDVNFVTKIMLKICNNTSGVVSW